ncbi:Uncharacterized protein FWK35_00033798, partial [Aphis craccivora]
NQFTKISIFLYCCNLKTNHCKYLNFSPNIYNSIFHTRLNFKNILIFFELFKIL